MRNRPLRRRPPGEPRCPRAELPAQCRQIETDVGSEPQAEPTTTSTPSPEDPSPSQDGAFVLPQECLESAETVQEATALIHGGASAIREFRPDELISLFDELEDLDAVAREQATACEEVDVSRTP